MRGALVHMAGDLLVLVGAIAAVLIIMATGWTPINPILSVLVAILVLRNAWDIVRRSSHILLEGTPDGLDVTPMAAEIAQTVPGIVTMGDLHVWLVIGEKRLAALHLSLADGIDPHVTKVAVRELLAARWSIQRSTIEISPDAGNPALWDSPSHLSTTVMTTKPDRRQKHQRHSHGSLPKRTDTKTRNERLMPCARQGAAAYAASPDNRRFPPSA